MKKWHITAEVTGSKYIGIVEAKTMKEAIELAKEHDEAHVSLCHQCSDQVEAPEITKFCAEQITATE